MNSNNLHILHGFVGNDPEVRRTENSIVASFPFATNASYTSKDGAKVESTDWHKIVAWGTTAETIEKHVKKGAELNIIGEVKTRSYDDKEGVKRYITETKLTTFRFCGSKKEGEKPNEPSFDAEPEIPNDLPF